MSNGTLSVSIMLLLAAATSHAKPKQEVFILTYDDPTEYGIKGDVTPAPGVTCSAQKFFYRGEFESRPLIGTGSC